jgi:hypothetical protein
VKVPNLREETGWKDMQEDVYWDLPEIDDRAILDLWITEHNFPGGVELPVQADGSILT